MSVEQEHPDAYKPSLDVYIAPIGAAAERHAAHLASRLRSTGRSVELGLDSKLKRSLELANKMSARFALIVGENEIAAGQYALKNMESGDQQTVTLEQLIERMK